MHVLSLRKKFVLQAVQLVVSREQAAQLVLHVSHVYVTLFVIEFIGHVVSQMPPLFQVTFPGTFIQEVQFVEFVH